MAIAEEESTVRVACVQASSIHCDTEANKIKFTKLCRKSAEHGAKIIVLPECSLTGYTSQDLKRNWFKPGRKKWNRGFDMVSVESENGPVFFDGPLTQHFQSLAKELGVYISVPFVEKALSTQKAETTSFFPKSEYDYFNSIVLVNPQGEIVGHYRKTNLWPYVDHSWASYGKSLCVVETEYGPVGLGVCFDVHKVMKEYCEKENIWTLLYSIAWVADDHEGCEDWFTNQLKDCYLEEYGKYFVVGANWSCDEEQDWAGYGYSSIYAPHGKNLIMCETRIGSEILFADLPRSGTESATEKIHTERLILGGDGALDL